MILEYISPVPFNLQNDIKNIKKVIKLCAKSTDNALKISYILIPQNPVNRIYPSSLIISHVMCKTLKKQSIEIIPTAKGSMLNEQSFCTFLASLKYIDIKNLAIITGDKYKNKSALHSSKMIQMAQNENLNIFCALKNYKDLSKKIELGVKNFITQPFFSIKDFEIFKARLAREINLDSVNIYCSIFLFPNDSVAMKVNDKKIGLRVPIDFIEKLQNNKNICNIALVKEMTKCENISLGFINFNDLLKCLSYF